MNWPEPTDDEAADGLHWKTRPPPGLGGRPFAWIDDEITHRDQHWTQAHHPGPALLHRIDPRHGLTDQDLATLNHRLQLHQS
ncbi:hypothetical protein [Streptomyces sp. NPDC002845]